MPASAGDYIHIQRHSQTRGVFFSSPSVFVEAFCFRRRLLFSVDFVILFFSYNLLKTVGLEGLPNLLPRELVDFARILVLKKEHSECEAGIWVAMGIWRKVAGKITWRQISSNIRLILRPTVFISW